MFFVCHFKSWNFLYKCQFPIVNFKSFDFGINLRLKGAVNSPIISPDISFYPTILKTSGFWPRNAVMHLWLTNTRGRCAPPSDCSYAAPFFILWWNIPVPGINVSPPAGVDPRLPLITALRSGYLTKVLARQLNIWLYGIGTYTWGKIRESVLVKEWQTDCQIELIKLLLCYLC